MPHGLAWGQMTVNTARLQHDPDALLQRTLVPSRIVAEHQHLARAALPVTLENLNGGCLARAVGPQQAKHFTAAHRDIDAANRFEVAVALVQAPDFDRSVGAHQCTPRIRFAIASCSSDVRSSVSVSPRDAAESGNTR